METVKLTAFIHRDVECIGISSPQFRLASGEPVNYYYQKKAGARWSRTNKCWYIPCTEKNYEILCAVLKGKVILEVEELKQYLLKRKKNKAVVPVLNQNKNIAKLVTIKTKAIEIKPAPQINLKHGLSKENEEALQKFAQQLILKSYTLLPYVLTPMSLLNFLIQ